VLIDSDVLHQCLQTTLFDVATVRKNKYQVFYIKSDFGRLFCDIKTV
jgi:hypothetical protein